MLNFFFPLPCYWLEVEKWKVSFGVTNSKLKNRKFHFELLILKKKKLNFDSNYNHSKNVYWNENYLKRI